MQECGDYNSVIGMNTQNSINRFFKRESVKHFPAEYEASLCGAIIRQIKNGLALNITSLYLVVNFKEINKSWQATSLGGYKA